MKKIFFISFGLFITVIFFSCKKETTDISIGTISVNINGAASTFSVQARATRPPATNGGYAIQVEGYKKDPSISVTNLSFRIESLNPIGTGTYTENTTGNPSVKMSHYADILDVFGVSYGNGSYSYGSTTNPVSITITEISASSIKGFFTGELQYPGGAIETLTNGEFYVEF